MTTHVLITVLGQDLDVFSRKTFVQIFAEADARDAARLSHDDDYDPTGDDEAIRFNTEHDPYDIPF